MDTSVKSEQFVPSEAVNYGGAQKFLRPAIVYRLARPKSESG